jgi:hypothetical protein
MKRREPPKVRSIGERGNSIPLEDWELEGASGGITPAAPSPIPLPYPNATGDKRGR